MGLTSRSTPHDDATDAVVYPSKSACLVETNIGLQACLYGVYWIKQEIYGRPSETACDEGLAKCG